MPSQPDAVMLFAAGFGTRMKHLTKDLPKPLIPVGGQTLVDHALDLVKDTRVSRIVANLHYRPAQLRQHLEPRGVICILEWPKILETGGGLRNALPQLGPGPVFTLNTDAVWRGPNPLKLLRDAWDPVNMDALLMGIPTDNAHGHAGNGDFRQDAEGRLTRGGGLIYGGAQIIKTERLSDIDQSAFSLNVIWDRMLEDGRLFGLRYPGNWCDVGHPEGVGLAEALLAEPDV